jgi:hypothetical protein
MPRTNPGRLRSRELTCSTQAGDAWLLNSTRLAGSVRESQLCSQAAARGCRCRQPASRIRQVTDLVSKSDQMGATHTPCIFSTVVSSVYSCSSGYALTRCVRFFNHVMPASLPYCAIVVWFSSTNENCNARLRDGGIVLIPMSRLRSCIRKK